MCGGQKLAYFTIARKVAEGFVAVIAGWLAGSISLVGFGIESFIEVPSEAVLASRFDVWLTADSIDAVCAVCWLKKSFRTASIPFQTRLISLTAAPRAP